MATITRKIEFDAGHRIIGHESKCRHLHGHRYVAEITVSSLGLDDVGRVIDFSVIKLRVGKWIEDAWDHNMILHPEDPLVVLWNSQYGEEGYSFKDPKEWDLFAGKDPYVMPVDHPNPTVENMAAVLYENSKRLIEPQDGIPLTVERVRLFETPNCWADHSAR